MRSGFMRCPPFGLHVGTRGAGATPEGLQAIARQCETSGYATLGFNDHVITANKVDSQYPYSKSGVWPAADTGTCLEQLMTIAFVAGVTEKIRLLTSVMVLPHRAPVLAAKMLATADVLSKGRLTVGVGIGWMAEEMAALQSPPYDQRATASRRTMSARSRRCGPRRWQRMTAISLPSRMCCSIPSRCSVRTRRSGSAAKASRHAGAPGSWATAGIR
jgi:hypothetical protein